MQSMKAIALITILAYTIPLVAADTITILNPADSSNASGSPLLIDGTSSQPNLTVQLMINSTFIGATTTDTFGDWNFSYPDLGDGNYTVTADLLDSNFSVLATDTNSFSVGTFEGIFIFSPFEEEDIVLSTTLASGVASLASTQVDLYVDNVLTGTTTSDSEGLWEIPFTLPSNGSHDLRVYLIIGGNPVAESGVTVIGKVPVVLAPEGTQLTILGGTVPTSGSGTGLGYSYSVSGLSMTITFDTAFASTPTVVATSEDDSSLLSTNIASVSSTQVIIRFGSGADAVHFTAMTIE